MSDLTQFLKTVQKLGYPNPRILSIAKHVDYNLDYFISDLVESIGVDKSEEFGMNALKKLLGDDLTIKIDISDLAFGPSYAVFQVDGIYYDDDEYDDVFMVNLNVIESKIVEENGSVSDLDTMRNEVDFSDWTDWSGFEDSIMDEFLNFVYNNCGFHLIKN